MRTIAASGGTPTGNVITHVAGSPRSDGNASNAVGIGGAVGDIVVVILGWENTGTITAMSHSVEGAMTLLAISQANGTACVVGYVVCAGTTAGVISVTTSGTVEAQDWLVSRLDSTGTFSVATVGATGTGTAVSVGTYSTATVNGMLLSMVKVDNTSTFASEAFGGVGATEVDITGTSTSGFYLQHSSAQSSANFTTTINTSVNWASRVASITAQ